MLTTLGLEPTEEEVYRALVGVPSADVTETALITALAPSQAMAVLHRLAEDGLAVALGGNPARYAAAPPAVVLAALHVAERQRLREAAKAVEDLDLAYRSVPRHVSRAGDVLDVVLGEDAVRDRFLQLNRAATREVLAFVRDGVLAVTSRENTAEDDAVERGVGYRVVLEREVTRSHGFPTDADQALSRGEQVRVVDSLPTRLLVVDRRIALLPLTQQGPGERAGALVVRPGPVLDSLVSLFELTWAAARPLDRPAA